MLPYRARVDLGAMAIKGYSAFPKAPASLDRHHEIVYCYIQDTRWGWGGGFLPLCRGAVGVFYSPSRLGKIQAVVCRSCGMWVIVLWQSVRWQVVWRPSRWIWNTVQVRKFCVTSSNWPVMSRKQPKTYCAKGEGVVHHSSRNFAQIARSSMIRQSQVSLKLDSEVVL